MDCNKCASGKTLEHCFDCDGESHFKVNEATQTSCPLVSTAPACCVALNLERFKVSQINCDGWIVVPEVERALKELFEKHNALVDFLSTAT